MSDLLKETKGVNFIVCSDEAEVMSNGRKQTFTYVIPKVEGCGFIKNCAYMRVKEVSKQKGTCLGNSAASRMTT